MKQFDSAILYFNKALDTARVVHDVPWTGVVSRNLGFIYYLLKQYGRSLALLKTDYTLSRESREWASAANTLCILADMDMDQQHMKEAGDKLSSGVYYLSGMTDSGKTPVIRMLVRH